MERWWAYRVRDVQAAADAVIAMDGFPESLVGGLGVIVKGYEGDPEVFYVFVNANDPTDEQAAQIEGVMAQFGESTALTLHDLTESDPRPHLVASGPADNVLFALQASYPGLIRERRPD